MHSNKRLFNIVISLLTVLGLFCLNTLITNDWANTVSGKEIENNVELLLVKLQIKYQNVYSIKAMFAFFLCYYLYNCWLKIKPQKINNMSIIGALFFSFCTIFGYSYMQTNSWNLIFFDMFHLVTSLVSGMGIFYLYYVLINILLLKIDLLNKNSIKVNEYGNYNMKFGILTMIILYIPYIIAFYPGTINWDAMWQLRMYMGQTKWSTHHPVMSTLLFGSIYSIFEGNKGIFVYCIIQETVFILTITYIIRQLSKMGLRLKYCIILNIWFALFTVWPINSITVVKDVPYCIAFLWFLYYLEKIVCNRSFKNINYIGFVLSVLFVCWMRNNGTIIVIVTAICLLFNKSIMCKFKWISVLFAALIISIIIENSVVNITGAVNGSKREALSIPFQQTARYVKEYYDQVTFEEKTVINNVLDYSLLVERYTPETSDPVKDTFKDECTNEQLKEYFIIWAKMFIKHPTVYIQATMNGAYGYFFPERKEYKDGLGCYELPDKQYVEYVDDIHFNEYTESIRNILIEYANVMRLIPFMGFFYSCGLYTWLLALLIIIYVYIKQKEKLFIYIPFILNILICIASPVNAFLRYNYPVMIAIPFLLGYLMIHFREKEIKR